MSKDNGGSAFPWQEVMIDGDGNSWSNQREGLSVRDYIAIKAMQGMTSNPGMWDLINERNAEALSVDAYLMADAMLKARS